MKIRKEFTKKELKEILAKHFDIDPGQIDFIYVPNFLNKDCCITYYE